jgi:DMSO/TMAO reductase YedYZ molybdopterin-dependent catalytic subunit
MNDLNGQPDSPVDEAQVSENTQETAAPGASAKAAEAKVGVNATAMEVEPTQATASLTPVDSQELEAWNEQVRRRMRQKSRRAFLGLGAGLVAGAAGFGWLTTRRQVDGEPWPFRIGLEVNQQLAEDYFSARRLAPTFSSNRIGPDIINGDLGLDEDIDLAKWRLQVEGLASQDDPLSLQLGAIKALPRVEMTTEFKCIEGWSVIVEWAGARFSDFMKAYPPETISGGAFSLKHPEDLPPYVSMVTPDGGYYVGLDMESALHPQTLLCYERNGQPLSQEHGAPLRLVIPVKYGVKNIKRIGTIAYSRVRPADYWAERGYDWYIGL